MFFLPQCTQQKQINMNIICVTYRMGPTTICFHANHSIDWPYIGLMLGQRRRRWPYTKPT